MHAAKMADVYENIMEFPDQFETILGERGVTLSGGQKQRVSIARAFATDADLILMDEPFVSLDQPTRERMQQEVLDIWKNLRRTIVFVTHNLEEAVFLGDRVITLSQKPTKIKADLKIDLPRPRDPLSPAFTEIRAQCFSFLHH
jgi:ABC-type nitrate/sulfonate/bicarbonate transport system ATPase subunit